jgi:hypothetical protein
MRQTLYSGITDPILEAIQIPGQTDNRPPSGLLARVDRIMEQLERGGVSPKRMHWLMLAESHLTRRLFGSMLQRIWALPVPTG